MTSEANQCEQIFDCTRCGDCCRGFGGTYLSEKDIDAISAYVSIERDAFIEKFCVPSGSRRVIRQRPDGYCVFWNQLCTIHPVKPRMCRQWPFLESVLVDGINWQSMASMCPGVRKDAAIDRVRDCIKAYIAAEPDSSSKS